MRTDKCNYLWTHSIDTPKANHPYILINFKWCMSGSHNSLLKLIYEEKDDAKDDNHCIERYIAVFFLHSSWVVLIHCSF